MMVERLCLELADLDFVQRNGFTMATGAGSLGLADPMADLATRQSLRKVA